MLQIRKKPDGKILVVWLSGTVDENSNFNDLGEDQVAEYRINCREIHRINSTGIKAWCNYFQSLRKKGAKLTFLECAPTLVEQANYLTGFIERNEIESLCPIFYCEKCNVESLVTCEVQDLKERNFVLPPVRCFKCNQEMLFDDVPEQFFSCLMGNH